jgi:hypothetical protein
LELRILHNTCGQSLREWQVKFPGVRLAGPKQRNQESG